MKFVLFAAMLLLAGCTASPGPPGPIESKNTNTFSRDATDCERKAALAGAGKKAEAFDSCMKARGRTPN
jgi:hypothetical protein